MEKPPDEPPRDPESTDPSPETPGQGPPPPPGMPSVPPPGMPSAPPPGAPQSPAPGPQSPIPESPQAPPPPPPPTEPQTYTGPVPPGGWQQPVQPTAPVGGQLASWGSRLGAYLIDALVLLVPALIVGALTIGGAVGLSGDDEDVAAGALIGATLLFLLIFAVIALLYAPLLMMREGARNGQTWGKQVVGIRVVRDSGQPFTFGPAALREVVFKLLAVNIASSIIPILPWFLNFFWPLWDDENRALHDMAASTHVIRA